MTPTQLSAPIRLDEGQKIDGGIYTPAPGYRGPAVILEGPGAAIRNATIQGAFSAGVLVDGKAGKTGSMCPRIENCNIFVDGMGIHWKDGLTDGMIVGCEIAHTLGHNHGTWLDADYQISATTPDAGILIEAGGVVIDRCHLWGDMKYGLVIAQSQITATNCRLESYGYTQMLIAGWNNTVLGCQFYNFSSSEKLSAIQLGFLNDRRPLAAPASGDSVPNARAIVEMADKDYKASRCVIEAVCQNIGTAYHSFIIADHEDDNQIKATTLVADIITISPGRLGPGTNSRYEVSTL